MKKEIRREFMDRRSRIDEEEQDTKSLVIQRKLSSLKEYRDAESLLIYHHFNREVRTDSAIETALNEGKKVCLPFNDWEKSSFTPVRISCLSQVDMSAKVPQPCRSECDVLPEELDIIIMPGVVFDIYGNRIGMGGGFYDRFLADVKSGVPRVALAFDFQIAGYGLPSGEKDEKVDIIISERRILYI